MTLQDLERWFMSDERFRRACMLFFDSTRMYLIIRAKVDNPHRPMRVEEFQARHRRS